MDSRELKEQLDEKEKDAIDRVKKITVSKAAIDLDLKQPYLASWINGKRHLTYNKILDIASKLGL